MNDPRRTLAHLALLTFSMSLVGVVACGDGGGEAPTDYDPELLASYRAAIPSEEVVRAAAPDGMDSAGQGLTTQALIGQPATFPAGAEPIATGVNGAIGHIIRSMKTIVETPPTVYNSETGEFLWGPYPNEDGAGFVAAYIKENEPDSGEDFRYQYALIRLPSRDLADATPVIWGGSQPDPEGREDYGVGVTLWDFEANRAFEDAHNPEHGALERGRFVALYARQSEGEGEATWVVSAFRGFAGKENPDGPTSDLDYFHGEFVGPEHTFHFLDYAGQLDVTDGDDDPSNDAPSALEDIQVRMVFIDRGRGRAEVMGSGGDIETAPEVASVGVAECWDDAIAQTWIGFATFDAQGERLAGWEDGDVADCGVFAEGLEPLDIPTLDDVDPELRAALDDVARNGIR